MTNGMEGVLRLLCPETRDICSEFPIFGSGHCSGEWETNDRPPTPHKRTRRGEKYSSVSSPSLRCKRRVISENSRAVKVVDRSATTGCLEEKSPDRHREARHIWWQRFVLRSAWTPSFRAKGDSASPTTTGKSPAHGPHSQEETTGWTEVRPKARPGRKTSRNVALGE